MAKRKTMDHLEYDSKRALELGYGCRYGDYKADHPNTRAEYERLVEQSRPPRKTTTKERVCPICGKKFSPKYGTVQTYCTPECKEVARYRNVKAAKERKKAQINTVATCPICGKQFIVGRQKKYCSPACANKANRINSARQWRKYRQEEPNHDSNEQ